MHNIIVLKFGSSVLRTRADLPNAVHEIYRWYRSGLRVIAVVSTIDDTTDELFAHVREFSHVPEPYATAEFLATGERASAALLGLALDRSGVPSRVLNPCEIGLSVIGSPLDSELSGVNVERLRSLLEAHPVIVVPGFFGTDSAGRTHVLGRGGSDLSGVFLAHAVDASRCRLLKDVDGVYERDPALTPALVPRRFATLNFADALEVAAPLIQSKAVSYLNQHGRCAELAAPSADYESLVHRGATWVDGVAPSAPSKVLLLGLGTIGFGVYERLRANPKHFEIIGALVQHRAKHESLQIPAGLLLTRIHELKALRPDLVVDALPGIEPSRGLLERYLGSGVHVVSAGKALIAEQGAALARITGRVGALLRHSAAVGGAAPMIELVEQCLANGPIRALAGVLSGTCNFVLDCCAEGKTLGTAIGEAQRAGLAEADTGEDLSGRDAWRKLVILSRQAFQCEFESGEVHVLDRAVAMRAREAAVRGQRVRQVARATQQGGRVHAQVTFEVVEESSLLGKLRAEWNALEVLDMAGRVHCATGRGAGRWPTTEAVIADLFELHRRRGRIGK